MKLLLKRNLLPAIFVLLVLSEIYLFTYKVNFALQLLFLAVMIAFGKNMAIPLRIFKIIKPVIIIFLLGFVGTLFNNYLLTDIFKDISYFSKPVICFLIGYFLFQGEHDLERYYKTLIFTGCVTAFIHVFGIVFFSDFFKQSVSDLRGDFGLDNFIEIFAFYIIIKTSVSFKKITFSNLFMIGLAGLLLFSIILYFSRTMLIAFILVGATMGGYTKLTFRSLKILGVLATVGIVFYAYLFTIKLNRNAKGAEAFFYKIKIAPEEIFNTKINREDHKDLWDHWRAYEAKMAFNLMNSKPYSYITGTGHGSLVNLRFQAPISEDGGIRYISRLHNGYVFVLYKMGVIGLILLVTFILTLYRRVYKPDAENNIMLYRLISSIGLFYGMSTLIITGIYIPKDAIIFFLGAALSFEKPMLLQQGKSPLPQGR